MAADDTKFERLARQIDPANRLIRAWSLKGGISAQVTALEIERPDGQTQKMIVRQHGEHDLRANPNIAADEFRLLQILQSAGIAAPAPYYLDTTCAIFESPVLVMAFIEGATDFAPVDLPGYLRQFAAHLAQIHGVDSANYDLSFLPKMDARNARRLIRPERLDEALNEGKIRDVLESFGTAPRVNRDVLLHGDYWVGNVMWQNGQLAAVIDFEDAAVGDPLADLGNSRLEIMWMFGSDAMLEFTRQYRARMPELDYSALPYYELCAALRPMGKLAEWAGDADTEKRMRDYHGAFVAQALKNLALRKLAPLPDSLSGRRKNRFCNG